VERARDKASPPHPQHPGASTPEPSLLVLMACHVPLSSLLHPLPYLLRRQMVIEAEEIEEIPCTSPGKTVPMRVTSPEHLEAWPQITAIVMLLERTRANSMLIQCHVATDDRFDIL
jgi:hypothetical protein